MARRHSKEGGNHLEQESNRQRTTESIDGGLHAAVDGQSLCEMTTNSNSKSSNKNSLSQDKPLLVFAVICFKDLTYTTSLAKWLRHPHRERQTPGSSPAFFVRICPGRVTPVAYKVTLQWLPC